MRISLVVRPDEVHIDIGVQTDRCNNCTETITISVWGNTLAREILVDYRLIECLYWGAQVSDAQNDILAKTLEPRWEWPQMS